MRKYVGEREMTEDEKKEKITRLKQQAERMTVVDKIKFALVLEANAADGLQEVIAYSVPGVLDNVDDRMFVMGKSAALLLESVKQRGSIHGLLRDVERRLESLEYEVDELEHPEKYQLLKGEDYDEVEKGEG